VDAPLVEVDRAVAQLRPAGCLIRSVYLNQSVCAAASVFAGV